MLGIGLGLTQRHGRPSWATAGAVLDMWFAKELYYSASPYALNDVPGWSFARTGDRFSDEEDGTQVEFATDVPRITDKSLAVDAAATNLYLNSGTPATQVIAVTAQAYTLSFNGTGTLTLSGASTAGPLVGTGANDRVSLTFTPSAGNLTLTLSGTITEPQLETGSVATPHIPTEGSTASATADDAKIDLGLSGGLWTNLGNLDPANGFTVVVEAEHSGQTIFYGIWSLSDGTTVNEVYATTAPEGDRARSFMRGGANNGDIEMALNSWPAETVRKFAVRVETDSYSGSINGSAVATDTLATIPAGMDTLRFGAQGDATKLINGYIRRLTIIPGTVTDAQLQALST